MRLEKIRRERISSDELTGKEQIICYIEIETDFSRGNFTVVHSDNRNRRLLGTTEILTSEISNSGSIGKYRFLNGKYLSKQSIDNLTSEILSKLSSKTNLDSTNISHLFAYSDAFVNLENPQDTDRLIRDILDSCEDRLPSRNIKTRSKTPNIAANENKALFIANGVRNILPEHIKEKPVLYLDFSSFISGIILDKKGTSNRTGIITGLGDYIFNNFVSNQGKSFGYDVSRNESQNKGEIYDSAVQDLTDRLVKLIEVKRVSTGTKRVGKVPVDVEKSHEEKVKLIGCDAGTDGDKLEEIFKLSQKFSSYGWPTLKRAIDEIISRVIGKLIRTTYEEELIAEESTVCISGRRLNYESLSLIQDNLNNMGFEDIAENLIFLECSSNFAELC